MVISTAVDLSAVARVVGIETNFVNLRGGNVVNLPQRIAVVGQGSTGSIYSLDKFQVTSAGQAALRYGFGSPIHLAVKQLLPTTGDGVGTLPVTVYPLDDAPAAQAATITVSPSGAVSSTSAARLVISGEQSQAFAITVGDDIGAIVDKMVTAVNATLDAPVVATSLGETMLLTAKWAGVSSNRIIAEIAGGEDSGITFAVGAASGGLINPDVSPALERFGNVWETMVLNCLNVEDTETLDKYQEQGEGRWGPLVRKPFIAFCGTTVSDVATAITVPSARGLDRINAQIPAPGSTQLPFVVAARALARIAPLANNNPAHDYGGRILSGIEPGNDELQWDYLKRNQAVTGGSSTVEVTDGEVVLSDVVTFFAPEGDQTPAYRFVVDIVKVTNILFNLDLIFASPEWDGAPLIPDDQATTNRTAKKPKMAVAAVSSLIDNLALAALISDPDTAKANTFAGINGQNPKRLDVASTMQVSGNSNIVSVDFNWGFFFG